MITEEQVMLGLGAVQDAATANTPVGRLMPATVVTFASPRVCQVRLDIDQATDPTALVPAISLLGCPIPVGARVMVLLEPPSGCFVTGFITASRQAGTVPVTFVSTAAVTGSVTYPVSMLNASHVIQLTAQVGSSLRFAVNVQAMSSTGFSYLMFNTTLVQVTTTARLYWEAIQV